MKKYWLEDIIEAQLLSTNIGKCEGQCGEDNVVLTEHGPRSALEKNPHKLCMFCAEEYEEYWDYMWADYYSSVL